MKATSEPSIVNSVDMMFYRAMRKTFNCATLTGTAALAAFLASAGAPAQAARHHHHLEQASAGISSHHRRHHHHATDDQDAMDTTPVVRHHHHHHADGDSDSSLSTATTPRHHRHHHHHADADDVAAAPTPRRHHHHHDQDASSDLAAPTKLHRHHHSSSQAEDIAYNSYTGPLTEAQWLAHVARYEAHLANLNNEHELREIHMEAHEANLRETYAALHSGNVVRAAEAFRGTPYVMGGTSRSGFDCSGFTRYIFGESAGVSLPRTAEEQYYTGQPIDKTDLRAGDLVFFRDTYRHGISHVGMYIGNGQFVHACNPSKGVTVSSLNEQYYINHWAGARRVISSRDATDE